MHALRGSRCGSVPVTSLSFLRCRLTANRRRSATNRRRRVESCRRLYKGGEVIRGQFHEEIVFQFGAETSPTKLICAIWGISCSLACSWCGVVEDLYGSPLSGRYRQTNP